MASRRFSPQFIETIEERSDLLAIVSEYLSLKRSGQNYSGLCPFHQEKSPSFSVNPGKNVFYCFGCGAGGNTFQFVEKIEGLSFPEVVERLAEREGIPLPVENQVQQDRGSRYSNNDALYKINEAAADYFHDNLLKHPEGVHALSYLQGRGIRDETIQSFKIGFALPRWDALTLQLGTRFQSSLLEKAGLVSRKGGERATSTQKVHYFDRFRGRIIFPIRNTQGKVIAFGGRVLDDAQPKYLNSPETSVYTKGKHLFALDQAKAKGIHPLIVVEGYLDAISALQAGVNNVVASLGTALTEAHLRLIRRVTEKLVLVFDGDPAGIAAALRAAPLLMTSTMPTRIVSLPAGLDPDSLIQEQGKTGFLDAIETGRSVIDFVIFHKVKSVNIQSAEGKMAVIHEVFPLIDRLNSPVEKSHYLIRLSEQIQVREEDMRQHYVSHSKKGQPNMHARKINPLSEKNEPIPKDQEGILKLLLQDRLDPEDLNGQLDLEDFTHSQIKAAISNYWNAEEARWGSPVQHITSDDETVHALLNRLLVSEIDQEQMEKTRNDCISRLREKRLDRERAEHLQQLGEQDSSEEARTLQKILDLKKASSHLRLAQ